MRHHNLGFRSCPAACAEWIFRRHAVFPLPNLTTHFSFFARCHFPDEPGSLLHRKPSYLREKADYFRKVQFSRGVSVLWSSIHKSIFNLIRSLLRKTILVSYYSILLRNIIVSEFLTTLFEHLFQSMGVGGTNSQFLKIFHDKGCWTT